MAFFFLCITIFIMFFQPAAIFPHLSAYQPVRNSAIIALITYFLFGKKSKIHFLSVDMNRYFVIFMILQIVSSLLVWSKAAVETFNLWIRFGILYYLIFKSINNEKKIKCVILVIIAAIGYLSYFSISSFVLNYFPGTRAGGFGEYENGNDLSVILVAIIPLLLLLFKLERNFLLKYIFLFLSGIMSFNILFTGSRSGLLALCYVGITSLLALKEMAKLLRITLIVSLLSAIIILGIGNVLSRHDINNQIVGDVSSEDRIVQWKAGIKMLIANPIFGVGREQFIDQAERYSGIRGIAPHNTIIQLFAETGFPGGFFFFLFAISPIIYGRKMIGNYQETEQVTIYRFLLNSLTGFWICAFFSNRYQSYILYVLTALIAVMKGSLLRLNLKENPQYEYVH